MNQAAWSNIKRSWQQQFSTQFATLVVLISAFTIVASILVVATNLQRVLDVWGNSIQLTVYLNEEIEKNELVSLEETLRALPYFSAVKYLSKEGAREKFKKSFEDYFPEMLEGEENPLPSSFDLTFKEKYLSENNHASISSVVEQISTLVGVNDISHGEEWMETYKMLASFFNKTGLIVLAILMAGCILIIGNSQSVILSKRREEIEILELIGATAKMIRKPYMVEGAFMGFLAGVGSLSLSYILFLILESFITGKGSLLGEAARFKFFPWPMSILLIGFTTLIGLLGAYLVVRRYNNGWAASTNANNERVSF